MDLPQLDDTVPPHRPYAAVFAKPWYGTAAVWRSVTQAGFALLDTLGVPARMPGHDGYSFARRPFKHAAQTPGEWDVKLATGFALAQGNAVAVKLSPLHFQDIPDPLTGADTKLEYQQRAPGRRRAVCLDEINRPWLTRL